MLQLVTYNIGGAKHLRRDHYDPHTIVDDVLTTLTRMIDTTQPTILALQEVGWGVRDGARYNMAALLAAGLGADYRYALASEITRANQPHAALWQDRAPFAHLSDGGEGNAFVTNLPPAPWAWPTIEPEQHWALSTHIGRPTLYSTGTRDSQPRNALVASLRLGDLPLYVINTHLTTLKGENRHSNDDSRTMQASTLRCGEVGALTAITTQLIEAEYAADHSPIRPILLAGDFNARPNTPEMTLLAKRFTRLHPDTDPQECWSHVGHRVLIDHILLDDPSERLRPARCAVITDLPYSDLSDHRPVLATFEAAP